MAPAELRASQRARNSMTCTPNNVHGGLALWGVPRLQGQVQELGMGLCGVPEKEDRTATQTETVNNADASIVR